MKWFWIWFSFFIITTGVWSSGMIPVLGTGGPVFDSLHSPLICFDFKFWFCFFFCFCNLLFELQILNQDSFETRFLLFCEFGFSIFLLEWPSRLRKDFEKQRTWKVKLQLNNRKRKYEIKIYNKTKSKLENVKHKSFKHCWDLNPDCQSQSLKC
jgi:hypothetical protein